MECWLWQGSGSLPRSALPLPNSSRPLASFDICGPQASAKSSGYHGSSKSNPHSDIRNLWTTATLSQPKLNVLNVYEDSDLEGSSETREWYSQKKAGHDSASGSDEWDDRDDNISFGPEELDDHTSSDLELSPRSSEGSHLEEDDEMGQCGCTALWAPTRQGAGRALNFCRCKTGAGRREAVESKFLGFPAGGGGYANFSRF